MDIIIGAFDFERETKNTWVFTRENAAGRRESQYVPKAVMPTPPGQITVVVRAEVSVQV